MRTNDKYLEKIADELTVFQRHLLLGDELTPQQAETFKKIDFARTYLQEGYSDKQVLNALQNDPTVNLQARRAREILELTYSLCVELRAKRSQNGLKYIFEELYRERAETLYKKALAEIEVGNADGGAKLLAIYHKLMKEAGAIAGVYDKTSNAGDKRKPSKIVIRRKTIIKNDKIVSDQLDEEAHIEDIGHEDLG